MPVRQSKYCNEKLASSTWDNNFILFKTFKTFLCTGSSVQADRQGPWASLCIHLGYFSCQIGWDHVVHFAKFAMLVFQLSYLLLPSSRALRPMDLLLQPYYAGLKLDLARARRRGCIYMWTLRLSSELNISNLPCNKGHSHRCNSICEPVVIQLSSITLVL